MNKILQNNLQVKKQIFVSEVLLDRLPKIVFSDATNPTQRALWHKDTIKCWQPININFHPN